MSQNFSSCLHRHSGSGDRNKLPQTEVQYLHVTQKI